MALMALMGRLDKFPVLGFVAGFDWIHLDVMDGFVELVIAGDKDFPLADSPGGWGLAIFVGVVFEWMQAIACELACGGPFELVADRFDALAVVGDDQVGVVGHDRAGEDAVVGSVCAEGEAVGNRSGLFAVESNGRVVQRLPGGKALVVVMSFSCKGVLGIDFGRWAVSEDLGLSDVTGPRSARIVGQPEAIAAEDEVVGERHSTQRSAVG